MFKNRIIRLLLLLALLGSCLAPSSSVTAAQSNAVSAQSSGVTAYDLIIAMNTLRVAYGHPALVEDGIINAVAQSTAQIMADNQMSWHIGDVSGRLMSAGYGGGAKVWATENFAVGSGSSIDQIMLAWSDASHMIPAVNAAYCNVGAGVAVASNGMVYYVLQAAYISGKACGDYTSSSGNFTDSTGSTTTGAGSGVPGFIVPVKIAEPDDDGRVYHVVQAGQSFWSIAVAYRTTINDIEVWNNLNRTTPLRIGQRLFIPDKNTQGYATPTPVGWFDLSTPDADGKIVHTVAAYQTLSSISQAYRTSIPVLLSLNGIQADWPLQVGQKLVIVPGMITPSPTPRPLTPIERLTPAADGKYYHQVWSGQTLTGVAQLYNISLNELLAWNGLNLSSVIQPGQRLLLEVTPPATETPTPAPETPTPVLPTATNTLLPTRTATLAPGEENPPDEAGADAVNGFVWIGLAGLVAGSAAYFLRRKFG